jgi:RNA polymerase sigma-70 factor (ECF subfamily)
MHRHKFLLFRVYRFQDSEAYGELYDIFFERIRRFLYFKLPTREDVDEATNEVFLRGWEYATSSRVEQVNAFFYRVARNVIADFYRHRKQEDSLEAAEELTARTDIEKEASDREEQKDLLRRLAKMREEYRDVLMMRYLDEMSIHEIGQALEKSSANVRVLLYRAKKALEKEK